MADSRHRGGAVGRCYCVGMQNRHNATLTAKFFLFFRNKASTRHFFHPAAQGAQALKNPFDAILPSQMNFPVI